MTMIYYHGLYEAYKRSFRVKNDHLTQAGLALGMAKGQKGSGRDNVLKLHDNDLLSWLI